MATLAEEQRKLEAESQVKVAGSDKARGVASAPLGALAGLSAGVAGLSLLASGTSYFAALSVGFAVGLAPVLGPAILLAAGRALATRKRTQVAGAARPRSIPKDLVSSTKEVASIPLDSIEQEDLDAELKRLLYSMAGPIPLDVKGSRLEASWIAANTPQEEISRIQELATEVFGDAELGAVWLLEPNIATDNKPPVQLLGASGGFARVENLLLRIQYGVLA